MIYYFIDRIWTQIDVHNQCSNIVLDTSINIFGIRWSIKNFFINMSSLTFFVSAIFSVKWKISLRQLLASTTKLLIFSYCLGVIFSSNKLWELVFSACLLSSRDLIVWLFRRVEILSWCYSLSFWRYRWMRTKPVIASISRVEDVWKVPKIYKEALICIFLSLLRGYTSSTLL